MSTQTTNYQCPACTGPLHFAAQSGMLECDYCSSRYDVAHIEQYYAEENKTAAENFEKQSEKEENLWDTSDLTDNWQNEKIKTYTCPSCAAQLICDDTTAATSCPYCGNPTVVPGQLSGNLKPDYIIPFTLSAETARNKLRQFYKGKRLLPKEFADENRISELQGVYVPFWLFDCSIDIDAVFDGVLTTSHEQGRYRITTTNHFDIMRKGRIAFENIPADASVKMADNYMNAIEPFDWSKLKPFSMSYLPGFLAEKYGLTAEECFEKAENRAENTALDILQKDISEYGSLNIKSKNTFFERDKVKYALLPVYMLTTKYKGKDYMFAMNGQTGKFVGNLPISKGKYRAYFAGITAAVTVLLGTALMILL